MKAITTVYRGYRFRIRLEARWAVFFDALGLQWRYEPEGFELIDGTRYLPDFHLPTFEGGCYVEVKGCVGFDEAAFAKAIAFTDLGRQTVLCVWDLPAAVCYRLLKPADGGGWNDAEAYFSSKYLPGGRNGWEMRMFVHPGYGNEASDFAGPLVESAVAAARGARFEFGESGAPA